MIHAIMTTVIILTNMMMMEEEEEEKEEEEKEEEEEGREYDNCPNVYTVYPNNVHRMIMIEGANLVTPKMN